MLICLSCACGSQHFLFLLSIVAAHRSISVPKQTGLHKPVPILALAGGYEDDGLAHGWMEKLIKSLS